MQIFYCDHFVLPLPEGHRFPMEKYSLLRAAVADAGLAGPGELQVPDAATDEALARVHTPEYVRGMATGELTPGDARRIGFPWSPGLVERSRRSVGGTVAAAKAALSDGFAANLAGGTHHAYPDRGEGFCVFNDVAVAVRALQAGSVGPAPRSDPWGPGPIRRMAILDLDVHQGNGTAAIFRDDPDVFTLSVHGENNFPFHKEFSDLDIELPDGTEDEVYLEAVNRGSEAALAAGPELAFYVAGADPFHGDRLGRLGVSKEGLKERDRRVYDACADAGVPVAVVMSGGYAADVTDTVDIHFAAVAEAARRVASTRRAEAPSGGAGSGAVGERP